jgi:hypothetical protein
MGYIGEFRERAGEFLAQYDLPEETAKEIEDFAAEEVFASYKNGDRDRGAKKRTDAAPKGKPRRYKR